MKTTQRFSSGRWGLAGWLVMAFLSSSVSASVEITSFRVHEGDGTINATIKVMSTSEADWSLDYETMDGTASDENGDDDYGSVSGKFVFGKGETTHLVPIDIVQDMKIEGTEYFELVAFNMQQQTFLSKNLSPPGNDDRSAIASLPGIITSGTITIIDDDPALSPVSVPTVPRTGILILIGLLLAGGCIVTLGKRNLGA